MAISSKEDLCNMALAHLGVLKPIANLDSDSSQEALACRTFFDSMIQQVFRDHPWPFATKNEALALIEETPNDYWRYSYAYPSSALFIQKIYSGIRLDNRQSQVPYEINYSQDGPRIFTDMEDALARFTVNHEEYARWPSDFTVASSYLLAGLIAPALTAGDPFQLQQRTLQLYQYTMGQAAANASNEQAYDQEPESELIRTREGDQTSNQDRYGRFR